MLLKGSHEKIINPAADEVNKLKALFFEERLDEAENFALLMTKKYYQLAFFWNALANIQKKLGKLKEAESNYRRAISIDKQFVEAYINLGLIFIELLKFEEAQDIFEKAVKLNINSSEAYFGLGKVFQLLGNMDSAKLAYQEVLRIKPDDAVVYVNLGGLYQAEKKYGEAEKCLRKALELNSDSSEALNTLSIILGLTGKLNEAEFSCRRAIELNRNDPSCYNNLATILRDKGSMTGAIEAYQTALNLSNYKHSIHSNLIFTLNYSDSICADDNFNEAKLFGAKVSENVKTPFNWWKKKKNKRLRVGFVSGDFINHPVGFFLEAILKHLATSDIELFAYSTRSREDALTARIKPMFQAWHPIFHLNDECAAAKIHDDGIDILVDLAGHTGHNRLPVFAWKPAPVQVSWLGYFATTGVSEIDYLFADETGLLPDHQKYFTEKIWYLPDTRLCFSPPDTKLPVSSLPALTNGKITFGNFQTLPRINDQVLELWSRILTAVPHSQLRLQSKSLNDHAVRQILRERLQKIGIDPLRVIPNQRTDREAYLAAHSQVDIILDSFPYTGGTTTCEALWMGVPTLTLAGNSLLSRQGASLMKAAGLEDWIANSEDEYISKAITFASNPVQLDNLRQRLREQVYKSPLFDAERFAQNLKTAFQEMLNKKRVL